MYRYKKGQFWKKKPPVPKEIRQKIYEGKLSIQEFLQFELYGKIPNECLADKDRKLIEKFGADKLKELDWELFNKAPYLYYDVVMLLDANSDDINLAFYQKIIDIRYNPDNYSISIYKSQMSPDNVTAGFKAAMPQYFVEDLDIPEEVKQHYYDSQLEVFTIIKYWDQLKSKHLHERLSFYCSDIDIDKLSLMMNEYPEVALFIDTQEGIKRLSEDLHKVKDSKEGKDKIIETFFRGILDKMDERLTTLAYEKIFKFVNPNEYLKEKMDYIRNHNSVGYANRLYDYEELIESLAGVPIEKAFEAGFHFNTLLDSDALRFIKKYGFKNIVEFTLECGSFFSDNNGEILKNMYKMYLEYGGQSFETRPVSETNRPYSKEEFYDALKLMLMRAPTNGTYGNARIDYRNISGPFRDFAAELFIDDSLSEEIKKAFYTKQITPAFIKNNPQTIEALRGKKLSMCFNPLYLRVKTIPSEQYNPSHEVNAYDYLAELVGYDKFMDFILNNHELFEVACGERFHRTNSFEIMQNDSFEIIIDKMVEEVKRYIFERDLKYSPQTFPLLKEKYPSLFLAENAPLELQTKFYDREIDFEFLQEHPEYIEHLKGIDIAAFFKPMIFTMRHQNEAIDMIKEFKKSFGDNSLNTLVTYGSLLRMIKQNNIITLDFNFLRAYSPNELLEYIESKTYSLIMAGEGIYKENMPDTFKAKYPNLFLPYDAPENLKFLFYNRKLTIDIIKNDMSILTYFKNTDIALGFNTRLSWLAGTFGGIISEDTTAKKLKIIEAFEKIKDVELQDVFSEFMKDKVETIIVDKLEELTEILYRLSFSNSSEMLTFRSQLATQILATKNPIQALSRIEEIFLTNNIPLPGKIYSVFQILHPNCEGFDLSSACTSPILAKASKGKRNIIIFADLLRIVLGSNNRSMRDYLSTIENGNKIFTMIANGEVKLDELDAESLLILKEYSAHLCALYNNTMKAKLRGDDKVSLTGDHIADINNLISLFSPNGILDYNLPDRIVAMYGHFAGIKTFEQAKKYFIEKREKADTRNREAAKHKFTLQPGDLVKGINDFKYLGNILQNGCLAGEFLGDSVQEDFTPLVADLSIIREDKGSIKDNLEATEAAGYGNIWLVLKDDGRFSATRRNSSEHLEESKDAHYDPEKTESFFVGIAGQSHYGIRTGFPSTDINYIIVENYDERIGIEIAKNGFYIPVVNKDGTLVFTEDDYDLLRNKMNGLKYYDSNHYKVSNNLQTENTITIAEQIPESDRQVAIKRAAINKVITNALNSLGMSLKEHIDGDLTEGSAELIDTGSTGRGTNMPGDGDFDFMMRLDKKTFANPSKLRALKKALIDAFGSEHANEIISTGDFRLKNVCIDGLSEPVDIDITFTTKNNKLTYSTDMALQDRLKTIKKQSPEQYNLVVANILLAKKVLKEAGAYKPNRGEVPQGGLGGVGIENWILQHNGSFIEAAQEFLTVAEGKSFDEFCKIYQIWDFGENHLAEQKGKYKHDNFVANNMSAAGYIKMQEALKDYLYSLHHSNISKKMS